MWDVRVVGMGGIVCVLMEFEKMCEVLGDELVIVMFGICLVGSVVGD